MKKFKSFSARLSSNILYATSILFVAAMVIAAISSHIIISEEAESNTTNVLNSTVNEIQAKLAEVESLVEALSWNIEKDIDDPVKLTEYTRIALEKFNVIKGFGIAFSKDSDKERTICPYSYENMFGDISTSNLETIDSDYSISDWFLLPTLLRSPVWTDPYYSLAGLGQSVITYSRPLLDDNGIPYGAVFADILVSSVNLVVESAKPYEDSDLLLLGRTGQFLNQVRNMSQGETAFSLCDSMKDGMKHPERIARFMMDNHHGIIKFWYKGQRRFMIHTTMANGWKASISCGYKDILNRTFNMHIILLLIGLLGLTALYFFSSRVVRTLTKPLVEISNSALSIANGNFNNELPQVKNNDEIYQLREAFEHMQLSLTDYIRELKETTSVKERIESELNIASKIQMSMLCKDFPVSEKYDIHAFLTPAKEIGGDLYDFFVKDNYLYFAVGDVSGKGVPASMYMAMTRSFFRFVSGFGRELGDTVNKINQAVCQGNETSMFVTFITGKLNIETGELIYCNAGHNPFVIVKADGTSVYADVKHNLALGVFDSYEFKTQTMKLEKGDRLIFYTDGVTEAEKADKSQYGEPRLLKWAEGSIAYESAAETNTALYHDVKEFTAGNEPNDDITLMTIIYR